MKGMATLKEAVLEDSPKLLPVLSGQVISTTLGVNLTPNDLQEKKNDKRQEARKLPLQLSS